MWTQEGQKVERGIPRKGKQSGELLTFHIRGYGIRIQQQGTRKKRTTISLLDVRLALFSPPRPSYLY